MSITQKKGIQPELRRVLTTVGDVGIPFVAAPPANAVESALTLEEDTIETVQVAAGNGTTIFNGVTYTYDAAPDPLLFEYEDMASIAALINATADWGAAGVTDLVITATLGGAHWNGNALVANHVESTTAGGGAAAAATATITAGAVAATAVGDTVTFDGQTYTRAGATDVPAGEFLNAAGLADCIDAEADWGAAEAGDITITADANGAEFNGLGVEVNYNRETAGGEDGTPAVQGAILVDQTRIYVSLTAGGFENQGWVRSPADFVAL